MASLEQAIVTSQHQMNPNPESDSQLLSVLYELSQQVQEAMEDMLKMINEIDEHSAAVAEEMERCKESALERKKAIEDERECFQKAAYTVLDVLNIEGGKYDDQLSLEIGSGY